MDIKTVVEQPVDLSIPVSHSKVCLVCHKNFIKYRCPRCFIGYCCLSCYKSHSEGCTEGFYKEQVTTEIKSRGNVDKEEIKKMWDILQKFEDESSQDLDDVEDGVNDKLANIDIENASVSELLDCLSLEERKDFEKKVVNGAIGEYVTPWVPWWAEEKEKEKISIVEERDDNETKTNGEPTICVPSHLPPFSSLSPNASPTLSNNLANILFSYILSLFLFNGDFLSDPLEVCQTLFQLSSPLLPPKKSLDKTSGNFYTTYEAITTPLFFFYSTTFISSPFVFHFYYFSAAHFAKRRKRQPVNGSQSSFHFFRRHAQNLHHRQKIEGASSKQFLRDILLASKKVYFYMVWSNELSDTLVSKLESEVFVIWSDLNESIEIAKTAGNNTNKEKAKRKGKGKEKENNGDSNSSSSSSSSSVKRGLIEEV